MHLQTPMVSSLSDIGCVKMNSRNACCDILRALQSLCLRLLMFASRTSRTHQDSMRCRGSAPARFCSWTRCDHRQANLLSTFLTSFHKRGHFLMIAFQLFQVSFSSLQVFGTSLQNIRNVIPRKHCHRPVSPVRSGPGRERHGR